MAEQGWSTDLSTGQNRPTKSRVNILSPSDGPGRWVNRVIDRGKYCALKLFEIYLFLHYPVDPPGRWETRRSTGPCLIALNALAVYTRYKGFTHFFQAYLMLIHLRHFNKLQALNFIIYYKLWSSLSSFKWALIVISLWAIKSNFVLHLSYHFQSFREAWNPSFNSKLQIYCKYLWVWKNPKSRVLFLGASKGIFEALYWLELNQGFKSSG